MLKYGHWETGSLIISKNKTILFDFFINMYVLLAKIKSTRRTLWNQHSCLWVCLLLLES